MSETAAWSPVCPKCGRLTDKVITPSSNQVFAGRLSPRAIPMGERVRCPRCSTWFPIAEGTRWEPRKTPVQKAKAEGEAAAPDEPIDGP